MWAAGATFHGELIDRRWMRKIAFGEHAPVTLWRPGTP